MAHVWVKFGKQAVDIQLAHLTTANHAHEIGHFWLNFTHFTMGQFAIEVCQCFRDFYLLKLGRFICPAIHVAVDC